ncbi:MAG: ImuA family protein [Pseudolabrys sp.]
MIDALRQHLHSLQRPPGLEDTGHLPFGIAGIDGILGGGLARGALHEIAASNEPHAAAASGFVLGLAALAGKHLAWIAEDMTLAESGAIYGPGVAGFGLSPERLLTVAAAHRRELLWAMEEALRCRAVGTVIGEVRAGDIDSVAVRRLSLAAAESGALALLLRVAPPRDASTAATRWIVGAAPSGKAAASFAAHLVRNRRGPAGSWILAWSDRDERFELAAHAQPVAAPPRHRPHRQVA